VEVTATNVQGEIDYSGELIPIVRSDNRTARSAHNRQSKRGQMSSQSPAVAVSTGYEPITRYCSLAFKRRQHFLDVGSQRVPIEWRAQGHRYP